MVFEVFHRCAPFVSPFSINNPDGWRYWFIHFANACRARQVYNNILHDNATLQAHFGRSGLNMLSYDPRDDEGRLYLFDNNGRASAKEQLMGDIPRLVSDAGTPCPLWSSMRASTTSHRLMLMTFMPQSSESDLEVITPAGGERRKANTIAADDIIKVKNQRSFFPMFLSASSNRKGIKGKN